MTIRFTCAECASVLKIKDELAGTSAKCPKCKTKFVVPAAPPAENVPVAKATPVEAVPDEGFSSASQEPQPTPSLAAPNPATAPETVAAEEPVTPPLAAPAEPEEPLPPAEVPEPTPAILAASTNGPAPLQLDDSDVGPGEPAGSLPPALTEPATGSGYALALGDDDDDLDSPPVLIGSASSLAVMAPSGDSAARPADKSDSSPHLSHKSPRGGSKHRGDEPFDPLKYLMSDSTSQKHNQFQGNMQHDSDLSLSDDSDYEIGNSPTPQPMTRSTPVPSGPRVATEKVDLATAAKMMKKAIKDSQADAAHQRHLDEKAGYDYMLFFREFGLRGLGILLGGTALVVLCVFLGQRMFSTVLLTPKLGYVSGTVKLDGQPFVGAQVYFEPREAKIEGSKRDRPRTSISITDDKGAFKMMYSPADRIEGVATGKCRVWVTRQGPKGEDVPNEWRQAQMKEFDITPGHQKAPFDINMESKHAGAK